MPTNRNFVFDFVRGGATVNDCRKKEAAARNPNRRAHPAFTVTVDATNEIEVTII